MSRESVEAVIARFLPCASRVVCVERGAEAPEPVEDLGAWRVPLHVVEREDGAVRLVRDALAYVPYARLGDAGEREALALTLRESLVSFVLRASEVGTAAGLVPFEGEPVVEVDAGAFARLWCDAATSGRLDQAAVPIWTELWRGSDEAHVMLGILDLTEARTPAYVACVVALVDRLRAAMRIADDAAEASIVLLSASPEVAASLDVARLTGEPGIPKLRRALRAALLAATVGAGRVALENLVGSVARSRRPKLLRLAADTVRGWYPDLPRDALVEGALGRHRVHLATHGVSMPA